jgi:8-amino-7-oxononanoate synthase
MKQTDTINWLLECEETLRTLDQERLRRTLRTCTIKNAREGEVQGKKCVLFSTNDYLGLSKDTRLIDRACSIIKEEGVGSGASRLLSGTSIWHAQLEKKIAAWKNKEASLVFGSGYAAKNYLAKHWQGPSLGYRRTSPYPYLAICLVR